MAKSNESSNLFEAGLAALLALGLAAGTSAHGDVEANRPLISEKRLEQLQSAIDRINLKAKFDVDDFDEPLGYGARWERRLEPSYRKGFMTLIDDFEVKAGYDPKVLETDMEDDSNFGIGPGGFVRWVFARQKEGSKIRDNFKHFVAGGVYSPFTHQPLSVEKAKRKMKVGDFTIMQANLNVIAGGSQLKLLNPNLPFRIDAHYLVSGEFQIHINRTGEETFGVKLIAVRTKEFGMGISLGYRPSDTLKITEVRWANKLLKNRLDFVPFELKGVIPRTNLFMVDYKFNFAKEEARTAYDDLLSSTWNLTAVVLKNWSIWNPLNGREKLQEMLLADVSGLEEVYQRDKNKSVDDRAIDRLFMGANDVTGGGGLSIRLGHRDIGEVALGNSYADNYVTVTGKDGGARYFYLPMVTKLQELRAGVGFFKEEAHGAGTMLFETNENKEIQSFGELSFSLEYRDKRFDRSEIRGMKDFLRKRIPTELFDQIEWGDWADERSRTNARVSSLLVFRPQALVLAENLAHTNLRQLMVDYVKTLPKIEAQPEDLNSDPEAANRNSSDFETRFHDDLNKIHQNLALVFDRNAEAMKRANAFTNLRSNPLFGEVGPGFLVHVLKEEAKKSEKGAEKGIEELLQHIFFETQWTAKNADTLAVSFGPCRNRKLYKAIMYIYSVLNNRSIDLRLIDDENYPELPDRDKAAQCGDE